MTGLRASQHWARVVVPRQRGAADSQEAPGPLAAIVTRRLAASLRLPLLASSLLVTGCTSLPFFGGGSAPPPTGQPGLQSQLPPGPPPDGQAAPDASGGPKVGILLPLSGPNGSLGVGMLRAAKLALAAPGSPALDAHDTAGPAGAGQAARLAVQSGDAIILGPLTSAETASVAPIAQGADIPVLAFTSDVAQARTGTWVMGVTPEQQVRRLVFAAKADGRGRIAALLPSNGFGDALAAGLVRACADAGLSPPTILTHAGTRDSITATMNQLADVSARRAVVDRQVKDTKTATDAAAAVDPLAAAPSGQPQALPPAPATPAAPTGSGPLAIAAPPAATPPAPAAPPLPPPPFDALLLGDTGLQLKEVIAALQTSGVTASQVRIMGPELWGAFAGKLRALSGAWYAAPDPSARIGFARRYQAAYGQGAKPLADIAYDAAALARSLAPGGYGVSALSRADGFAGVDGVFTLQPDGHVHRALAIFQIQPGGGGILVQAAPRGASDTGS